MKLYLCGGGAGKQINSALQGFSKTIDNKKAILYIPLAMDEKKYNNCYEWFSEEMKYMNLTKFEMVRSSLELSKKSLSDYCALFIGGGNTYKLLNELKQYSNYEKIYKYLYNDDGIIFGGSAGAIIFGKDINSCLLEDTNVVNLKETSGFNLLNNYSILCHLKKKNFDNNKEYLRQYSKKHKLIYLPEEDVIVIENKKISLIGKEKYIIFKDGEYNRYDYTDFIKCINE